MVLIVQNLDERMANYGDNGVATIISNCAWKWFCNTNNYQTAKTLSDTLGRDIAIGLQPEGPPLYLNPVDYWHLEAIFGHLKQAYPGMCWAPPLAFDPNPHHVKG